MLPRTPFHYFPMTTLVGRLLVALFTLVAGTVMSLIVLVRYFRLGHQRFWTVRDRSSKSGNLPAAPSALHQTGVTHRRVKLARQNVSLHVAEAGDPRLPTMLLVHGFPECWFSWRHQIRHFQHRFRVVAVNLRGYGDSDKPEGVHNYSSDILVADLVELVQSLRPSGGRVTLVAHDWGGVLAWTLVHLRPDLIDRFVVLNAPHPLCWRARIERTWTQLLRSWYMFAFNAPRVAELLFRADDFAVFDEVFGEFVSNRSENEVYKHYFSQPYGITGPLNFYRAALRGYGKQPQSTTTTASKKTGVERSRKVQPKTAIIWGRQDTALVAELASDSAALCRDATVHYLDDCSHWIQIHRPQEVNRIMDQFLTAEE